MNRNFVNSITKNKLNRHLTGHVISHLTFMLDQLADRQGVKVPGPVDSKFEDPCSNMKQTQVVLGSRNRR